MSSQPTPSTNPHATATLSVWLVDDSKGVRSALRQLLHTCEGVRCTAEFHSPNAVLSALASRPGPDAILLDIQMGAASGLDAIRSIKALSRETQVIMFTTCYDSESKSRALQNGASDFLAKSSPLEKIVAALERARQHPAPHLKPLRPPFGTLTKVMPAPGRDRPRRLLWFGHSFGSISGSRHSRAQSAG
jgi:DNA-binding NtrC family response regulator